MKETSNCMSLSTSHIQWQERPSHVSAVDTPADEEMVPLDHQSLTTSPTIFHDLPSRKSEDTPVITQGQTPRNMLSSVEQPNAGATSLRSESSYADSERPIRRIPTAAQHTIYGRRMSDFKGRITVSITGQCPYCKYQHTAYQRTFSLTGCERINCQRCHRRLLGIGTETPNTTLTLNVLNRRSSSILEPNLSLACTNDPQFLGTLSDEPMSVYGQVRGDIEPAANSKSYDKPLDTPRASAQNIGRKRSAGPDRTIMSRRIGSRIGNFQSKPSQQISEKPLVRQSRGRFQRVRSTLQAAAVGFSRRFRLNNMLRHRHRRSFADTGIRSPEDRKGAQQDKTTDIGTTFSQDPTLENTYDSVSSLPRTLIKPIPVAGETNPEPEAPGHETEKQTPRAAGLTHAALQSQVTTCQCDSSCPCMQRPHLGRRPTVATDGSERELSQPSSGSPSSPSTRVPTFDDYRHLGAHLISTHERQDSTQEIRAGHARSRSSNLSYVAMVEDDDMATGSGGVELHRHSAFVTLTSRYGEAKDSLPREATVHGY